MDPNQLLRQLIGGIPGQSVTPAPTSQPWLQDLTVAANQMAPSQDISVSQPQSTTSPELALSQSPVQSQPLPEVIPLADAHTYLSQLGGLNSEPLPTSLPDQIPIAEAGKYLPLLTLNSKGQAGANTQTGQATHTGTAPTAIPSSIGTLIKPTEMPVKGTVTQDFDTPVTYTKSGYHGGVDIAVPIGTPIPAPQVGGKVVQVGDDGKADYGKYIVLQGADGVMRRYGHLSAFNVQQGQSVQPGQVLGLTGNTGNSTGPHLHFEMAQPSK